MDRKYIILFAVLLSFSAGCSTLFVSQQLSENYAAMPGVKCDAPEAIDRDLNSISNSTRIHIILPEKKSIRKIIIYSPNISNFILYESIGGDGEWRVIKSVKGNNLTKIEIPTQITTDAIRMFITDTRTAKFAEPGELKDTDGNVNLFSRQVDASPQIQEIELYGLVNSTGKTDPKAPIF
jgi:hypothetical protein